MVILVAEGDVGVQFLIWKLLKAAGFTVLTAGSGEAALQVSRNHSGPIDLLLSDIEMPRMNGLDLCGILSQERPGIKVLLMSGDLRWKEQSMGHFPLLEKPFTLTSLKGSLEGLLGPIPSLQ